MSQSNPESEPNIRVVCPSCLHVSYFSKRVICAEHSEIYREKITVNDQPKYKILLHCTYEKCKKPIEVEIDCEGYK